jgi:protein TonB
MKPVLYRPGSKWSLVTAFTAAAVIHVSALAFSPAQRSAAFPVGGLPEINIEPAALEPEATPEAQSAANVTAAPPVEPNDFSENSQPTPHHVSKSVRQVDAISAARTNKLPSRNGKVFALSAPRPIYPYEARAHHITGSGAVLLVIDPVSGTVLNATMTESTGSPILDQSAVGTFRHWRFKSGTPSPVRIPFTFTMFGAQF